MKSKETILITGASGMVANALSQLLQDKGYEVRFLSRNPKASNHFGWDISKRYINPKALEEIQHIIHLAGANIGDGRWTAKRKKLILESRVESTRLLYQQIKAQNILLKTFISASAVGYYGTSKEDILFTEDSPNGTDFLASVCQQWEKEVDNFSALTYTRVLKLRLGVVIDKNSGALSKMVQPIKMGFGAIIGSGNQFLPWIHLNDLSRLLLFALENKQLNGIYNAVAPQHITNEELTLLIAKRLKKRLWLPKIPGFILQLLLGEMATIVLNGNRVSCNKLLSTNFQFNFPTIEKALDDLFK